MFTSGRVIQLLLFLQVSYLFGQNSIEKNPHVQYKAEQLNGNYEITYTFLDIFNNKQTYRLTMPVEQTNLMIRKFGVPNWLFEPYVDNPQNNDYREKVMASGLFRLNNNVIEVDKSAVLSYYSETFARPIAEMIVSSLDDYGADNRRNRIEFAMRFIQDIPYGVPEYNNAERHFGGVNIPPKMLINGFGDCDSKVLLFVGILTYLIPANEIIFLNQKEHVLSAIKEKSEKGLTYVRYKGNTYLVAETAGPGKRMLGEKGNYFRNKFSIETLKINPPQILPYGKNQPVPNPSEKMENPGENILILKNRSSSKFRFQLSADQNRWQTQSLKPNEEGRFIFNSKVTVYIRYYESKRKKSILEVESGKTYKVFWNKRKKKWELSA